MEIKVAKSNIWPGTDEEGDAMREAISNNDAIMPFFGEEGRQNMKRLIFARRNRKVLLSSEWNEWPTVLMYQETEASEPVPLEPSIQKVLGSELS